MPDSLIRFFTIGVAFLATGIIGQAQSFRRADSAFPTAPNPAFSAGANANVPAGGSLAPMTARTPLVDPNTKLAVGDQVSIEIMEDREPATPRVITATGDLEVQPLGRVNVAGKTTSEAASEIKRKLEADYYFTATVRLSIDRVNRSATMGKVQVQGEVRAPGVLEIFTGDNLTLNEAILRCGNFKEFGDATKVTVTRRKNGVSTTETINVQDIQKKGQGEKDIKLEDGDRIFIPKARFRILF